MSSIAMSIPQFQVNDANLKRLEKIGVLAAIVFCAMTVGQGLAYADGETLTDIFRTKSFTGSWEVINKFNWAGWLMNMIITVFCFIGLWMVFYQRLISMLYLSSSNLFDQVYDLKNSAKGGRFFGVGKMAGELYNGNRGVGLDVIFGFLLSLLPNVKAYSDYNPEKRAYNLEEGDTIMSYMLKTAFPTILLTFFFTIGFSGTLAKAYGTVADGMAAAADKAVDVNLAKMVNRVLSVGDSYVFTLGTNGSATGKFGEKVARDIYGQLLSKMDILDTESRLAVGKVVEGWVWTNVLNGKYEVSGQAGSNAGLQTLAKKSAFNNGQDVTVATEADVTALSYDIIFNNSKSLGDKSGLTANIKTDILGKSGLNISTPTGSTAGDLNLHLIIRKDRISDANFFVVPKKE